MKKRMVQLSTQGLLLLAIGAALCLTNCKGGRTGEVSLDEIEHTKAQLDQLLAGQQLTGEYLTKFDTLDFVVFSHQEWARFHETHDQNIKVYWPDGHYTVGLEKHIEDMKAMFVYAPDTRIKEHPIRFGSGKFTAVTGVFEGTFTKPMPVGNGKFIQPTGKSFSIPMCTIGIWENGVMVEEHLFWDGQTYMKQMGVQ
ncbi:MAG: ester cyclase [Culturomica sp.]|nr:ester cyclase [Culturomica sp.]